MPHFDRETGDAAQIVSMGEETTFKLDGKEATVPTHEFNARFRPGEPYEISAGKFDRPAAAAPKPKPATRRKPKAKAAPHPKPKAAPPAAAAPTVKVTGLDAKAEAVTS